MEINKIYYLSINEDFPKYIECNFPILDNVYFLPINEDLSFLEFIKCNFLIVHNKLPIELLLYIHELNFNNIIVEYY